MWVGLWQQSNGYMAAAAAAHEGRSGQISSGQAGRGQARTHHSHVRFARAVLLAPVPGPIGAGVDGPSQRRLCCGRRCGLRGSCCRRLALARWRRRRGPRCSGGRRRCRCRPSLHAAFEFGPGSGWGHRNAVQGLGPRHRPNRNWPRKGHTGATVHMPPIPWQLTCCCCCATAGSWLRTSLMSCTQPSTPH